jgi:tRNA A-37 threonylcarbamoyl transferase component Bud32
MFARIYEPGMRLIGGGAFDNPLLSSHLFGFFSAYWLSVTMTCKRRQMMWLSVPAMAVMFMAVIGTGSRTPLVALTMAALWLCFICWNRRSVGLLIALALSGATVLTLFAQMIIERGDSYRLEIWQKVLHMIADHPWIGHGYSASLAVDPGNGVSFQEPHSFVLGVLYYVGIIGLLPWLFFLLWGLLSSWRQRVQPMLIIASTWLIFGIGAGLTEGGGIISRPKEHWFLLWIPLALIAALSINQRARRLLTLPVQKLSVTGLEQLSREARIIEEDGLGPKVLCLSDGSFLKLFRRRRWYTSGSFNPYSERFAVNSEQLRQMGIPTPQVLNVYRLDDGSSAVHYAPLPGHTLRQVLQSITAPAVRQALIERFGKFMAQLHEKGVYFRSLHLGNVLVLEDGEFGLIDLADLRIYPTPLSLSMRQRNLRHMQRYTVDKRWLFEDHLDALLQGYAVTASKSAVENLHRQVLAGNARPEFSDDRNQSSYCAGSLPAGHRHLRPAVARGAENCSAPAAFRRKPLCGIDGLRGYLAFGVFVHHSIITWIFLRTGVIDFPPSNFYSMLGQGSVALFFMITGFLFWSRLLAQGRNHDWLAFGVSRFPPVPACTCH